MSNSTDHDIAVRIALENRALRMEAIEAWEEFSRTGLHVSSDEVIAWLESWGTENELSAPTCHT